MSDPTGSTISEQVAAIFDSLNDAESDSASKKVFKTRQRSLDNMDGPTTFYARIPAFGCSLFALQLDKHNSIREGDEVSLKTAHNFDPLPSDWYWHKKSLSYVELRHCRSTEQTRRNWERLWKWCLVRHPGRYKQSYKLTAQRLQDQRYKYILNTKDRSIAHFIVLHVHNEWPRIMRSLQKFVCVWRQWYYGPGGKFEKLAAKRFNELKDIN